MLATRFSLPSYAKINWSLRVLSKRGDGYHEVETVLQTVSLKDNLGFALGPDRNITLICNDPEIPTDESNLIVKAAHELRKLSGVTIGACLQLEKQIPAKAGLGGASSNAAVALMGLARLWNLDVPLAEFEKIGATLGTDVPFFFHGGCALATGTGASIKRLPDGKQYSLIIITPGAGISTAEAYQALDSVTLTSNSAESMLSISRRAANLADFDQERARDYLENDFECVIFDIEPETDRARTALMKAGAFGVLLAGSGSSVFGMFENKEAQNRALKEIQREPKWRVSPCVTLSRTDYSSALVWRGI